MRVKVKARARAELSSSSSSGVCTSVCKSAEASVSEDESERKTLQMQGQMQVLPRHPLGYLWCCLWCYRAAPAVLPLATARWSTSEGFGGIGSTLRRPAALRLSKVKCTWVNSRRTCNGNALKWNNKHTHRHRRNKSASRRLSRRGRFRRRRRGNYCI